VDTKLQKGFAALISLVVGLAVLSIVSVLFLTRTSKNISSIKGDVEKIKEIKDDQGIAPVEFTASFEIYTKSTKRIFTSSMYHNLSSDVYITADNPSVIHVKKSGVTWRDFFETLPMTLSEDCLVTGTKQTFCTGEDGVLRFFINGEENRNSLNLKIESGDSLKVDYE